jgi:hypothetical protein
MSLWLVGASGVGNINDPAVMLYEAKDDASTYNGMIVTLKSGDLSSTNGMGVNDVDRTWTKDLLWDDISMASDSNLYKSIDRWGSIVTLDKGDSAHPKATISYPNEQVYALAYVGAEASSIEVSGGGAGTQLGDVLVKDSEISSVSTKNLIVVGGSCINSVAANLLGGLTCGPDFTTKTGIGSGQFLIQSLASTYTTGKIALVVAGYEAADTVNAATYLRTQAVDTTVGKKYQGTSATTATLVTTSA